jgi:hypothetical protein
MDLLEAKSRIAGALVESIFRRARYRVTPIRGTQALRIGHEDFSPSFGIATDDGEPKYLVEVKYHPSVEQFTALENQRRDSSIYTIARLSQVQIMYRARLLSSDVRAGPESIEVRLFTWEEVPWSELAFPSVKWSLDHFREVRGLGSFSPRSNPPGETGNM